jgi:enolase
MPVPLMNILNGGMHAGNNLSIQEFQIIPAKFNTFKDSITAGVEIYHELEKILVKKLGLNAKNVGDEGGFAPNISKTREALNFIEKAIEKTGYSGKVFLGLDCASNSFYKNGGYKIDGKTLDKNRLFDYYEKLVEDYDLISIEDPFNENDFKSFSEIKSLKTQVIGDDLFTTNIERLKKGIKNGSGNALLLKVNQIGTLTEALETTRMCKKNNYNIIVSHRSGDTEDSFISDLSVGIKSGQIKTGAPARAERTSKYNRLLEIESKTKAKLSTKILEFA